MDIQKQYEKETGLKAIEHITDGVHSVPAIEIFAFDYVNWLEQQVTKVRKREEEHERSMSSL